MDVSLKASPAEISFVLSYPFLLFSGFSLPLEEDHTFP